MRSLCIFSVVLLAIGYWLLVHIVAASSEERQALEQQLAALETQMQQYEATIDEYRKQGKSLRGEIKNLEAKIAKINLQVKAINVTLAKLDKEINENKNQIQVTEDDLTLNKSALTKLIRYLYEQSRAGLVEVLLKNPKLSDFFTSLTNTLAIQDSLATTVARVTQLRDRLLGEKEQLAEKREDAAALKSYQDAQKRSLQTVKTEKNKLLTETKGRESTYQEILKLTRKTAAQIRSRIFELLGGGQMSFEEAYQFAKFAEQATGVRASLILAVLEKESLLGQNVGRCSYKTAMPPTRDLPIFLALVQGLGINPETVTVSCPNRDGLYGGAMGPAQFIPSTWNLYTAKVAEITGSNPPSPWRNGDAFAATALYLKDSMKGCDSVYSRQIDTERCAAAKYYSGARWRRHLWGYGDRVINRAQQLQSDIDTLNS